MKDRVDRLTVCMLLFLCVPSCSGWCAELVALWEFDYGSGIDSCGGNHGSAHGSPEWVTGRIGDAVEFDGIDDYVDCGDAACLDIADAVTVAAWVKTDDAGNGEDNYLVAKGRHSYALHHGRNNRMIFFVYQSGWHVASTPVDPSFNATWHHLVGTYDGREVRLYIDGELKEAVAYEGTIENRASSVGIGCNSEGGVDLFKGALDEACIFHGALTEDEIRQLYEHGATSFLSEEPLATLTQAMAAEVKRLPPREAVQLLESTIAEQDAWRIRHLGSTRAQDVRCPSDIRIMLAQAKEAMGCPLQEVTDTYRQAVLQPHKPSARFPSALMWLSQRLAPEEYARIVRSSLRNSDDALYNIHQVARYLQSSGDWAGFEKFLDTVLSETNETTSYATAVARGLGADGIWAGRFFEYCRSKPECTRYVFRKQERAAESRVAQQDFAGAARIYQDIVGHCLPHQSTAEYEYGRCECLFNMSKYEDVVKSADDLVQRHKATERESVCRAIILKGRACVHLGDMNGAIAAFLTVTIEYPEADLASEATFLVGYCHLLAGRFEEATAAFDLVVKDYPETDYASQARSSLERIQAMTN